MVVQDLLHDYYFEYFVRCIKSHGPFTKQATRNISFITRSCCHNVDIHVLKKSVNVTTQSLNISYMNVDDDAVYPHHGRDIKKHVGHK